MSLVQHANTQAKFTQYPQQQCNSYKYWPLSV